MKRAHSNSATSAPAGLFNRLMGRDPSDRHHPEVLVLEKRLRGWVDKRTKDDPRMKMVHQAIDLMMANTSGKRDNGEPNKVHPLWIANCLIDVVTHVEKKLAREGRTDEKLRDLPELFCIAIMHDLLEDCPHIRRSTLQAMFGKRVADGVFNLSNKYYEDDGTLVRKDPKGSPIKENSIKDMLTDPLSLISKMIDRAHNFKTAVDIEPSGNTRKIVYQPETVTDKLREASRHLIPAGDPMFMMGRYEPVYHHYILAARDVLNEEMGEIAGRLAKQDMKRTMMIVDNPGQRERIIMSIRPPGVQQVGLLKGGVRYGDFDTPPGEPSRLSRVFQIIGRAGSDIVAVFGNPTVRKPVSNSGFGELPAANDSYSPSPKHTRSELH